MQEELQFRAFRAVVSGCGRTSHTVIAEQSPNFLLIVWAPVRLVPRVSGFQMKALQNYDSAWAADPLSDP